MEYATRLKELIEQISEDLGLEVLEYDLFTAGTSKILRLFIDREGGVTIQDCSKMSRELGTALDLEDLLPFAYNLEVSSPGVDRPLKTPRDFNRNQGRLVKINLTEVDPELGRKIIGKVIAADENGVQLELDKAEITLQYERILSAKVELQF